MITKTDNHYTVDLPEKRQRIKIKLADGKERELEHTQKITFWNADGKPISAEAFIQQLFGDIPELFKDEAELRTLWSRPDTRKSLLTGMAEKAMGTNSLRKLLKSSTPNKAISLMYLLTLPMLQNLLRAKNELSNIKT